MLPKLGYIMRIHDDYIDISHDYILAITANGADANDDVGVNFKTESDV